MTNSRSKGKRGELEVAELICEHGFEARRGQQHRGGSDSPDVIHSMVNLVPAGHTLHVEVKRRQQLNLYKALDQVIADAQDGWVERQDVATVFHRKDGAPWLVTLDARDFLSIVSAMHTGEPWR